MILAGDIGGTKTHLGLFDSVPARPRPIAVRTFSTLDYPDLPSMIAAFLDGRRHAPRVDFDRHLRRRRPRHRRIGGADQRAVARSTRLRWRRDSAWRASGSSTICKAMAYSIPVLREGEVHVLQEGEALRGGNIALIAAGTGLGEALLHNVDGRFVPSPSEGGHADFSARTEREISLLRHLTARYGRADVEHVVSGRGLINIHRAIARHRVRGRRRSRRPRRAGGNLDGGPRASLSRLR
jgi:glucokinase